MGPTAREKKREPFFTILNLAPSQARLKSIILYISRGMIFTLSHTLFASCLLQEDTI